MKKFSLFLMAVAMVMFAVAASQAASVGLLSDYTFDTADGGQVVAGALGPGSSPNGAVSGAAGGGIGAGVLSTTTTAQWFNEAVGSFPNVTAGSQVGTESIWMRYTAVPSSGDPMLWAMSDGTNNINHGAYFERSSSVIRWYNKNHGDASQFSVYANSTAWDDGGAAWHLLTVTYNLVAGAGNSRAQIYFDGVRLSTNVSRDTLTDMTNLGNFTHWSVNADVGPSAWGGVGKMDDHAVWNTQLNDAQATALYNLGLTGVQSTKYNAKDASALFDAFLNTTAAGTSDGKSWTYVANGLSGAAGSLGADYVVLDGSGGGMKLQPISVDVTWTGGANTAWTPGTGNWKATVGGAAATYGNGVNVTFDDSATGTTTADIAASVTPTSVTFNNSSKTYTVTGTAGIGGSATVLKQGTGTVTMGSVNSYTGVTTVEAGKLILQGTGKAMAPVLTSGGANIKGGMLVLDYLGEADPVANVKSLLTASYTAGAWNAGKFQSSTATSARGLGWSDNTGTSKINVAYTLYGDANLDGTTNFTDLSKLLSKYNQAGVWSDGDFNYDGTVNFLDLSKMLSNYNQTVGTLTPSPEPSSVILLATMAGLIGAWVIRRRRR